MIRLDRKPVPVPDPISYRYPFDHMQVGESFTVSLARREACRVAVRNKNYKQSRKHFIVRTVEENGERIFRVWRDR